MRTDTDAAPSYGRDVVLATLENLGVELEEGYEEEEWGKAVCPLHDDSKPSFAVMLDDGGWLCRSGCGSSMDLAHLVHRITGDPVEQIRRKLILALPVANLSIDELVFGRKKVERKSRRPEALFYERGDPPAYMLSRGFTDKLLRDWEVGWDSDLRAAVIPVRHQTKLVGLVRRLEAPPPGFPKYLNSRGMSAKGYILGIDKIPLDSHTIVLVEGPTDAMWLHQHGLPGASILGSSMSAEQANEVKKRFWTVVLAFDNDKAGKVATFTVSRLLGRLNLQYAHIPHHINDIQDCNANQLDEIFHYLV